MNYNPFTENHLRYATLPMATKLYEIGYDGEFTKQYNSSKQLINYDPVLGITQNTPAAPSLSSIQEWMAIKHHIIVNATFTGNKDENNKDVITDIAYNITLQDIDINKTYNLSINLNASIDKDNRQYGNMYYRALDLGLQAALLYIKEKINKI